METPIRAADFTDSIRTIGALNTKLNEANADLAKWKVNIEADVVSTSDGFALKIKASRSDGSGFIKTFSPETISYYAQDTETLVDELVDDILLQLFKQQIKNTVSAIVDRGLRNARIMEQKS